MREGVLFIPVEKKTTRERKNRRGGPSAPQSVSRAAKYVFASGVRVSFANGEWAIKLNYGRAHQARHKQRRGARNDVLIYVAGAHREREKAQRRGFLC